MADLSKPLRAMKRILILLLALIPVMASAQEITVNHNIKDVVYENIIESDVTYDDALKYILAYGVLNNVVTHDNMIAGDLAPQKLDYTSAGYTRMKVPLYLSNGYFSCRMIFRFKEGRYKVEALGMIFHEGGLGGTTSTLYDGYGVMGFEISIDLVLKHLENKTTFILPSEEW